MLMLLEKKQKRKNENMVYCGLYSYLQRVRVITLFPNISYCFFTLCNFAKVFERNVWRVLVGHLHNAARALSSPSQCFQMSINLGKDLFCYLWYWDKKQIEWHWWNSTDLELIDMFLISLNAEIVACILSFRKSFHRPNLENTSKYGFLHIVFSRFGGKIADILSMRVQVILDSSFARRVQPL